MVADHHYSLPGHPCSSNSLVGRIRQEETRLCFCHRHCPVAMCLNDVLTTLVFPVTPDKLHPAAREWLPEEVQASGRVEPRCSWRGVKQESVVAEQSGQRTGIADCRACRVGFNRRPVDATADEHFVNTEHR